MEKEQRDWWKKWIFRMLTGLLLFSLVEGVPLFFVWRVSCR